MRIADAGGEAGVIRDLRVAGGGRPVRERVVGDVVGRVVDVAVEGAVLDGATARGGREPLGLALDQRGDVVGVERDELDKRHGVLLEVLGNGDVLMA